MKLQEDMEILNKRIESCKTKSELLNLVVSAGNLSSLMSDLGIPHTISDKVLWEDIDWIAKFIEDIDLHDEVSTDVLKVFKDSKMIDYSALNYPGISSKDIADIMLDFANDFDPRMVRTLKETLVSKCIIAKPIHDDYTGYCSNVEALGKSYIVLPCNELGKMNFQTMITLSHEFGHLYENRLFSTRSPKQVVDHYDRMYYETISTFFEDAFSEYLIKNHIYKKEAILDVKSKVLFLKDMFEIISKLVIAYDNEILQVDENDIAFCDFEEFKTTKGLDYVESDCRSDIIYSYGSLISKYYLDIYKQDKKDALRLFYNFIFAQGIVNDVDLFESTGILDTNYNFLKKYIKENDEETRKILIKK